MTTILAIYEGGVLRPIQPLPLAEGETVEVTVNKSAPPQADWERQLHAAKSIQEWVALANTAPNPGPDIDLVKTLNETR